MDQEEDRYLTQIQRQRLKDAYVGATLIALIIALAFLSDIGIDFIRYAETIWRPK